MRLTISVLDVFMHPESGMLGMWQFDQPVTKGEEEGHPIQAWYQQTYRGL